MICNSTPIIFLAKINQLVLLKNLFREVTIPESVKNEVLIENKPDYLIIKNALESGWIKISKPKKEVDYGIGKGENSAINLALENKGTIILDDSSAVKVAKAFNIKYIRTTTLIFLALQKGIIKRQEAIILINLLIENGYYIKPSIYADILNNLNKF